jgi:hypothetical protein
LKVSISGQRHFGSVWPRFQEKAPANARLLNNHETESEESHPAPYLSSDFIGHSSGGARQEILQGLLAE